MYTNRTTPIKNIQSACWWSIRHRAACVESGPCSGWGTDREIKMVVAGVRATWWRTVDEESVAEKTLTCSIKQTRRTVCLIKCPIYNEFNQPIKRKQIIDNSDDQWFFQRLSFYIFKLLVLFHQQFKTQRNSISDHRKPENSHMPEAGTNHLWVFDCYSNKTTNLNLTQSARSNCDGHFPPCVDFFFNQLKKELAG